MDFHGYFDFYQKPQNYYLNTRVYKEYKNSIKKFFDNLDNVGPLLRFVSKQIREVQTKPLNKLNNNDAMIYALIGDSLDVLSNYYPGINSIVIDANKVNKLETILTGQRVGIFRGILLGAFYTFFYDGKGSKVGRQYITNPITISHQKYITLITLDPNLLDDDEEEKNKQLSNYIVEFENMLHEAFETEYNNREGDE